MLPFRGVLTDIPLWPRVGCFRTDGWCHVVQMEGQISFLKEPTQPGGAASCHLWRAFVFSSRRRRSSIWPTAVSRFNLMTASFQSVFAHTSCRLPGRIVALSLASTGPVCRGLKRCIRLCKRWRTSSPVTQIRLGSQEFPDRKKERSFLRMHASPNTG